MYFKNISYKIYIIIFFLLLFKLFGFVNIFNSNKYSDEQGKLTIDPKVYLNEMEIRNLNKNIESQGKPNMYLNQLEIEAIKSMIRLQNEPWYSAYFQLLRDANMALEFDSFSPVKNGGPSNGHNYYTESPYCGWKEFDGLDPDCRDGHVNPLADRHDYREAINLGESITNLGLAYALTGKEFYAKKAVLLINNWTINNETRMNPIFTQGSLIELSITIPGLFYGADLISDSKIWPEIEKLQFRQWVKTITTDALSWHRLNNFENWRINFIAAAGAYLGEEELLIYAFGRFKELIATQINIEGQMVKELDRTKSLFYSLYALNAMCQTAEIARHYGINLYDFKLPDGRGLELALDYHSNFAIAFKDWPFQQIEPLQADDSLALYELAYSHWKKQRYLDVIQEWGRPMYEKRVLKHITLTHANRFSLLVD